MQTVHVRINDAATGQPTPVRVRFTSPAGYHAPFGRLTEFATETGADVGGNLLLDDGPWAYIDGSCEISLPPGPITIEVSKGFEYLPLREDMRLTPGKLSLRLTIERWAESRLEGWYSGDVRAHFLTPHAALLEAAAEDLAVVNLLAMHWRPDPGRPPALPNLLEFSGQHPAVESPGHLVVVNTLNTGGVRGQLALLNCHRVVYPLSSGSPHGLDNWTLADWCDQCHRKGGLVVWLPFGSLSGEGLADLVLGKIDAVEAGDPAAEVARQPNWYDLLNCGLRVPLARGSGKKSNDVSLGRVRTYARLHSGEEFNYRSWIEAVRAGCTFVSSGPLLTFTVNGQDPGSVLDLPAAGPVRVHAAARSLRPFDRLEVLVNGQVVTSAAPTGLTAATVVEAEVPVPASGWLAARCAGPFTAHTSPVYVQVAGQPLSPDAAAIARLVAHLDRMLEWVQREARCENDKQREDLAAVFQAARGQLLRLQPG